MLLPFLLWQGSSEEEDVNVLETCALIDRARDRHLAFSSRLMNQAMAMRFLSDIQRDIIMEGFQRDQGFLTLRFPISIQRDGNNVIGVVGASNIGGQPAQVDLAGTGVTYLPSPAGPLGEMVADTNPTISFVPTGVSSAAVTLAGATWTVNAYQYSCARIATGPGSGPASLRRILSNTTDTIVLEDAWDDLPVVAQSVIEVVPMTQEVSEQIGVVTTLPARDERVGYLVKLYSDGTPYLDVANPISVELSAGIPLPPHLGLGFQGLVRLSGTAPPYDEEPLFIVRPADRHSPGKRYALYEENGKVFFCGGPQEWSQVVSVEVPYTPLPPDITVCGDYLVLPGSARAMLVSALAYEMALRAQASEIKVDINSFKNRKDEDRGAWMEQYVSQVGTARISQIEESN